MVAGDDLDGPGLILLGYAASLWSQGGSAFFSFNSFLVPGIRELLLPGTFPCGVVLSLSTGSVGFRSQVGGRCGSLACRFRSPGLEAGVGHCH